MKSAHVGTARGILRNAAALFLVGVFAKGAGLIIVVLIARYLGADAMGLYALLYSVAFILETFISVGMSDSLVREVARRPEQASSLYHSALRLVVRIGLIPAAILALAAFLVADDGPARMSLLVIAVGTPVTGAYLVSQAVLQGKEKMLLLTWVTFVARLLSLVLLAYAFHREAGLAAAFASRVLFFGLCLITYFVVLRRERTKDTVRLSARDLLSHSAPFAINKAVRELGVRLPSFILPGALGLTAAGIFDSANRIRSTLGMMMGASIIGLMPTFARSLALSEKGSNGLIGFSVKYMCIGMAAVATGIVLFADWIIVLLFGREFSDAVRPLQILAWAQVLIAVDAVLQQALLATGATYPAIRHSAAGVAGQLAFVLPLALMLGLPGAACGVLLSSALMLALDLRYVVRNVAAIAVGRFVAVPLASAGLIAGMLLLVDDANFTVRLLVAAGSWSLAMALFRVFPREELRFMMQLVRPGRAKPAGS